MPEPNTEDAGSLERPVFQGAWNAATVEEKEAHNAAVRAWKRAQGLAVGERTGAHIRRGKGQRAEAQRPMAAGDGPLERHAADLATLEGIIHSAPIMSDRIRAVEAKQRILSRVEQEALAEAHGPLVALRDALSAIPPEARVTALGTLLGVEQPATAA